MQKRALITSELRPDSRRTGILLGLLAVVFTLAGLPADSRANPLETTGTTAPSAPRKITCRSQAEALQLGNTYAVSLDGSLVMTSGTRSMEPLIHGKAYVVVRKLAYDTIAKGSILVYMGRPNATKPDRVSMLHRTVARDSGGWLMRGDNNARTESWDRVTPANYLGTVEMILEYPQT